jgi:predicted small secreted protein
MNDGGIGLPGISPMSCQSTPLPSTVSTGANMKYWIGLVFAACGLALAGCNTMEGMGTDISRGGQKIQDAARHVRQDWRQASVRNEHEYEAARAHCAGLSGADHDACMDQARARYNAEMSAARKEYPRTSMRAESEEDRLEDAYDAAVDRCESLRGPAEDQCIADARIRYHQ